MLHGFLEVTLQATQHEVILYGFLEVTSECQVILHSPAVRSVVSFVLNISYLYYNIINVDYCFDRHEVVLNNKLNHTDLKFTSVNMKFTVH